MNESQGAAVVQHLMNDLQGPMGAVNGATIQHHLKRLHDEGRGEFGHWQFVKRFEIGEQKALRTRLVTVAPSGCLGLKPVLSKSKEVLGARVSLF